MKAVSLRERLAARNPFPPGAGIVGVWQVVTGLAAYGFLTISGNVLGATRYGALSAMWALAFLAGPGFFLPLEQEISRVIAARKARGVGDAPFVARASLAGAVVAGALALLALVAGPWLIDNIFNGSELLLAGLILVLFGYAIEHSVRGVLAGHLQFPPYGKLLGTEAGLRLGSCLVLAAVGVGTSGPYGFMVGVSAIVAASLFIPRARRELTPGPPAQWSELSSALGFLITGNVLAQALMNSAPLAAQIMGGQDDPDLAGRVLAGLVLARVPLFLFQAVQAALLPELATLASAGRVGEFRAALWKLLGAVGAIAVAATIGAAVLGPWAVRTFFGPEFVLSSADMAILAGASSMLMLAVALSQARIALKQERRNAACWALGMVGFALGALLASGPQAKAEFGFLVGGIFATTALGWRIQASISHPEAPLA